MRWRDALVGGIVAAVLFSAGKKLFALYLAHAGMATSFGAAGSLAVLLMWLYFSAAVLLLGAEAAAARVEAREGQPVKSSSASDKPGAPAMPAPGTGASNHANAPRGGVHDAPHAPVLASAAHRAAGCARAAAACSAVDVGHALVAVGECRRQRRRYGEGQSDPARDRGRRRKPLRVHEGIEPDAGETSSVGEGLDVWIGRGRRRGGEGRPE